jgi:hypothetical protein
VLSSLSSALNQSRKKFSHLANSVETCVSKKGCAFKSPAMGTDEFAGAIPMTEQANLTRYDLVKGDDGWVLKTEGRVVGVFDTKAKALGRGGPLQRLLNKLSGGEGTVRIHTEIGGIEEERTYPRSRDPRKSLG